MTGIKIDELRKSFGKHLVLDDVNLEIRPRDITTILGPNASGKTTLIKSILGMVLPDKGHIIVGDVDVSGQWRYKDGINYLPQIAQFPDNLRVHELITFIEKLRGKEGKADSLIKLFELEAHLQERISILSGGTKQKVNIVLAFMYDNDILILDEPTNGLDPVALVRLKELIRREKEAGKCIIITTHIMQLVEEMADDIVYMLEGRIHFQGNVGDLKERYQGKNVEECIAIMLANTDLS